MYTGAVYSQVMGQFHLADYKWTTPWRLATFNPKVLLYTLSVDHLVHLKLLSKLQNYPILTFFSQALLTMRATKSSYSSEVNTLL